MPIISFVTPKGGAGKTTTTVLVACELAAAGETVVILDADPNQPITDWASKPIAPPTGIEVVSGVDQNNILDVLDEAAARARWVIIDVEGSANLAANYAIAGSDAVIIPAQKSQTDARQAVRAIKLVRDASKAQRRPEIPHALLFTRTSAIIAGVQRDVVEALAQFPSLEVQLAERSAYQAIFAYGGDLRSLPPRTGGNIVRAIENAGQVTDAIRRLVGAQATARSAA